MTHNHSTTSDPLLETMVKGFKSIVATLVKEDNGDCGNSGDDDIDSSDGGRSCSDGTSTANGGLSGAGDDDRHGCVNKGYTCGGELVQCYYPIKVVSVDSDSSVYRHPSTELWHEMYESSYWPSFVSIRIFIAQKLFLTKRNQHGTHRIKRSEDYDAKESLNITPVFSKEPSM